MVDLWRPGVIESGLREFLSGVVVVGALVLVVVAWLLTVFSPMRRR